MQKLLIIGTVWPEPTSSAAGTRMMQLIDAFKRFSYEITFASTASSGPFSVGLQEINVHPVSIQLNHSSFDDFIKTLQPDVVLFDRFMIEEQFGWRVAEHCPNALRILDTEDLHCLRFARTQALKQNRTYTTLDLNNDLAVREIAAIYRCDLSLIISEYEMELLNNHFKIDASLLIYVPFLFDVLNDDTISKLPTFDERHHFITIGNFLHEPNRKSVLYLKEHLWPLIKKQLPQTELHVYGAYPTPQILQLHQPKNGFLIKGRAEDAVVVMEQAKVLLAPLQIGAGLKGKLAEAMLCGTPSVTTCIGAEGMFDTEDWCGFVTDDVNEMAKHAVALYTNQQLWEAKQQQGFVIYNHRFDKKRFIPVLMNKINELKQDLLSHRQANFIGVMLSHHQFASTKYMAKWIEEKSK